jgi:hypothetical protein
LVGMEKHLNAVEEWKIASAQTGFEIAWRSELTIQF